MAPMENFLEPTNDKMKLSQITLIAFLSLLYACKQEEIITTNNEPLKNDEPVLLWQVPLDPDTIACISIQPYLYNSGVLFSNEHYWNEQAVIVTMVDTADQHVIWQSGNFFNEDCPSIDAVMGGARYAYNNLFATLCGESPRVIDLNTGNVVWDNTLSNGDYYITGYNSTLFYTHLNGTNPFSRSTLFKSDILLNQWDTILSLPMENDYSSHIYPPTVLLDNNNDTILFFQNRQWTATPSYDGKIDLYAYNLSGDSILWENEDIDPSGGSAVFPPLLYNGKVYFKGEFRVYCLDATTGELLWSWLAEPADGDLMLGNLILEENKLIVKTATTSLYALSPESGDEIWKNVNSGWTPNLLTYFEGVVYYVSGGDGFLNAVNIDTGEMLWRFFSPNNPSHSGGGPIYNSNPTIDPITKRLYITDRFYLSCFQLK